MIGIKIFDFFKKKTQKFPGVAIVSVIITSIIGLSVDEIEKDIGYLASIYAASVLCYFYSGFIDDLLFGPLFGVNRNKLFKKFFGKKLDLSRSLAINKIDPNNRFISQAIKERFSEPNHIKYLGLYGTTKQLLVANNSWDTEIKMMLDISKAARSFLLIISILIVIWIVNPSFLNVSSTLSEEKFIFQTIFKLRWAILVTLLIAYYVLRYYHMIVAYKKVSKVNLNRRYNFQKTKNPKKNETFLYMNDKLVKENDLKVYKQRHLIRKVIELYYKNKSPKTISRELDRSYTDIVNIVKKLKAR